MVKQTLTSAIWRTFRRTHAATLRFNVDVARIQKPTLPRVDVEFGHGVTDLRRG